jgi:hypothetical protein
MSVQDIIARCRELGVTLAPGPSGTLRVAPPGRLPAELREELRRHKQEVLTLLLAEQSQETEKPDYQAIYQQVASDPLFDEFPLIDDWLVDHHPVLWRKIRALDDALTSLARQGADEATYRATLEELVALCRAAKSLREGTWSAMLVKAAVLGEEVWVVKDEEAAQAVMGDGRAIYFTEEILQLKGKTPEQIKAIHTAKRAFPGSRLIQ